MPARDRTDTKERTREHMDANAAMRAAHGEPPSDLAAAGDGGEVETVENARDQRITYASLHRANEERAENDATDSDSEEIPR